MLQAQSAFCLLTSSKTTKHITSARPHPFSRAAWPPEGPRGDSTTADASGARLHATLHPQCFAEAPAVPQQPSEVVLRSHPFLKWGNWGLERQRTVQDPTAVERTELNPGHPASSPGPSLPCHRLLPASDARKSHFFSLFEIARSLFPVMTGNSNFSGDENRKMWDLGLSDGS